MTRSCCRCGCRCTSIRQLRPHSRPWLEADQRQLSAVHRPIQLRSAKPLGTGKQRDAALLEPRDERRPHRRPLIHLDPCSCDEPQPNRSSLERLEDPLLAPGHPHPLSPTRLYPGKFHQYLGDARASRPHLTPCRAAKSDPQSYIGLACNEMRGFGVPWIVPDLSL